MLNTTLRCNKRSNMAAATMGSSKIFPHETGTGTGSFARICPECWGKTASGPIPDSKGVIGNSEVAP